MCFNEIKKICEEHLKKKLKESKDKLELKGYLLEIVVFICGAVVMIFELTGSRILAPYLGNSIFVWSSLIGVILGSLSFGYWYGGKLADKKASLKTFSLIILLSALTLLITTLIKDGVLNLILNITNKTSINLKWSSLIVVIILFTLPSALLGMVSPYAVKLKLKSLKTSGRAVGNLYAISTLGSIVGTFLAGFWLIPLVGSTKILYIQVLLLIVAASLVYVKKIFYLNISLFIIAMFFTVSAFSKSYLDFDTQYHRVWVEMARDKRNNEKMLIMRTGYLDSSSMYVNSDELAAEYTKYFNLAKHFNPKFKKTLMIGGAAYSYPKYYLKNFPDKYIDVVEIDPGLTALAKKYFKLKSSKYLKIYHEDGRVFLNRTSKKYDVVMNDVFKSYYSLPFHLTTVEAVEKIYNALNDNGVLISNVISCLEGEKSKFLRAEYATYKKVFPQVYLFPVYYPDNGEEVQNIIMVALKSSQKPEFKDDDPVINGYLKHLWKKKITIDVPILTDEYAPVDYYNSKII